MSDTTFVSGSTVIQATWLNDINDHVYNNTPISPATTVHPASVIANTPAGTIAATTVQAAIDELDTEKVPLNGTGATGTWGISVTGNAATATALASAGTIPSNATATTQSAGTNNTSIATTAFVQQEVPAASTSSAGKVELATEAEVATGTSTTLVPSVDSLRKANIVNSTAVASTSGTSIDFTSIPSWVKRITIMLDQVSTNGTSIILQLGDAGGVETSGYVGQITQITNGALPTVATLTDGFTLENADSATDKVSGCAVLSKLDSNTWVCSVSTSLDAYNRSFIVSGSKTTSATLDRVRITSTSGTDTFDAGQINISYE